ncbi:MAG: hypothetical protein IKN65_02875 [Clostridia bacterium]|nr:hypothetical protein [Clostridia bacterium]
MKAKKILIPIIVVIAILAILGGTFAGLWFFTDLLNFLKPANDVFSNQIEKALNLEGAKFSDYSDFLKDYKEVSDKSIKSKMNMSAKLNLSNLDSKTKDVINKSKITVESNYDVANSNSQSKVGLYADNSEVLTVDIVNNKDKIGIGCKDLSDKYIAVSMEDLIKYFKENSSRLKISKDEITALEKVSENLNGSKLNAYDLLYISDDDLKHFDETYRDVLKTLISKDCYSSEKNVEVSVDGDDVKTTGYYLTLTGEDAYKFVEDLANLVKDDDVISRLATDKINMILEASGQDKISEKDVDSVIDEALDKLLKEIESIKDEKDSAVQIAVYSKNNKPVRIDVNSLEDVEEKDDKETLLSIEYAKDKNIYTVYNNGKAYMTITDEYSKKSKEEKVGKLTAKVSGTSLGTLDYEIILKDNENKLNLSLDIPLAEISGNIKFEAKGNYKKEPVDLTGEFNFKYKKDSIEFKFDGNIEYGDVSVPELTSSNTIDVMKLNEKELETELNKILKKASEVLPGRLKLIGVDVKAEDIYKEKTVEPTTTTETPATTNSANVTLNQEQLETLQKLMESNKELLNKQQ